MFPVEPPVFVREIPSELVITRCVMDLPDAYGVGSVDYIGLFIREFFLR